MGKYLSYSGLSTFLDLLKTNLRGHTIENSAGTDMPQEENLQFVGVYTEDDPTNDRTKVNIVREMTSTQMQSLTAAQKKGFIRTTDEPDNPYAKSFVSMQLLWENPNPTSAFPAQGITLANDNYDLLLITTASGISTIAEKGRTLQLVYTNSNLTGERRVTYVSDTSLNVGNATYNGATSNTYLIPVAVYGIKL